MKKYGLLFLLLLGISSTAWGYCTITINIDEITCGEEITGSTWIECSGTCRQPPIKTLKTYVNDNVLYADIYVDCESPCGSSVVTTQGTVFAEAKCGWYVVVVRVWCDYTNCNCFPYCWYPGPVLCGVAAKYFAVNCDDCGFCPCRCTPCRPCCLR
jgi:hypothetical protein